MGKTNLGWKYDWVFKLSDGRAKSEGYGNTEIKGAIYPESEYPYYKAKNFIVCGKLNCNDTKSKTFICG